MIVFFTVIIPAVSVYTIWDKRAGAEAVQETRQLILTLHRLSAEIEAIRAQMGRLPKDEAELVALRGKPMPTYYRDSRVSYLRDDRNGYRLDCCVSYLWGHGWGWIVCFYGPEAVQRLHAVLF
jgi:hypothetical protein